MKTKRDLRPKTTDVEVYWAAAMKRQLNKSRSIFSGVAESRSVLLLLNDMCKQGNAELNCCSSGRAGCCGWNPQMETTGCSWDTVIRKKQENKKKQTARLRRWLEKEDRALVCRTSWEATVMELRGQRATWYEYSSAPPLQVSFC